MLRLICSPLCRLRKERRTYCMDARPGRAACCNGRDRTLSRLCTLGLIRPAQTARSPPAPGGQVPPWVAVDNQTAAGSGALRDSRGRCRRPEGLSGERQCRGLSRLSLSIASMISTSQVSLSVRGAHRITPAATITALPMLGFAAGSSPAGAVRFARNRNMTGQRNNERIVEEVRPPTTASASG
jgi:hypothetical protein